MSKPDGGEQGDNFKGLKVNVIKKKTCQGKTGDLYFAYVQTRTAVTEVVRR